MSEALIASTSSEAHRPSEGGMTGLTSVQAATNTMTSRTTLSVAARLSRSP
jgi:hypothetical protein